ncbi:leucine--tRNA ligase [Deltaproteobacteria bacterium TL4]
MSEYNPVEIASKWQKQWKEDGIYDIDMDSEKNKFYMLTMFPYPSGDLHIGHWYAIAPSDALSRYKRMQGNNVFFPIGFDSFGLPAENAAIKHNIHPKEWTKKNIERMRGQLRNMGTMFDWSHEIVTCESDYYKWSQWLFLKFHEKGLVYREYAPVDFCTKCNTTLAREQVVGENQICERCDTPVIKKALNQWKLRITKYADELLKFDDLTWPDRVITMQTNWIGKSQGVEFALNVDGHESLSFRVYTTRPDTVFGMTFCVLSPEHDLVTKITSDRQREVVTQYQEKATQKSEIERTAEDKEKDGVFTGAYAINPVNQQKIPIWIADYVLSSYGTGAIMAVPAHDTRDFAFAKKYNLAIPIVICRKGEEDQKNQVLSEAMVLKEDTVMVNSGAFSGLEWPESFNKMADWMREKGIGERQINYRLHDWLISRQRMWGTPIPMIHCDQCGAVPVPFENLPVVLPDDADFKPTGESPLKYHLGFLKTTCPQCGKPAERETDTMDTFICSSWYQYAYLSPYWRQGQPLSRESLPFDADVIKKWMPVDQYTGGVEHATMHLLYFRFFTKVMADIGLIDFREPAKRLFNQGMILGEDHEKMSKSRGNVVNPDDLVKSHGTDVVRTYLMFLGPWEAGAPWNPKGIEGASRFLRGLWMLCTQSYPVLPEGPDPEVSQTLKKTLHQTLKKVTLDYEQFKFNTAIAALMSFRNVLKENVNQVGQCDLLSECFDTLILMLAPIAPHLCEELWMRFHHGAKSIHCQSWPQYNEELATEEVMTLVVQINGKVRDRLEIPVSLTKTEIEKRVLETQKIKEYLMDSVVKRVIVVQNKLVNIVV